MAKPKEVVSHIRIELECSKVRENLSDRVLSDVVEGFREDRLKLSVCAIVFHTELNCVYEAGDVVLLQTIKWDYFLLSSQRRLSIGRP